MRGHCCRAFDDSNDVQPIEAKEEIHHWENHTGDFRVLVKSIMLDHVLFASSEHPPKRCSSAGIVIVLSTHLLLGGIIATTVRSVSTRVTLMIGDLGTG